MAARGHPSAQGSSDPSAQGRWDPSAQGRWLLLRGGQISVLDVEGVDYGSLIARVAVEQAVHAHPHERSQLDELQG